MKSLDPDAPRLLSSRLASRTCEGLETRVIGFGSAVIGRRSWDLSTAQLRVSVIRSNLNSFARDADYATKCTP